MLDLTQCDPLCIECVKHYAKKHRLKKGEKFEIQCSGILRQALSPSLIASLDLKTPEDLKAAQALVSPMLWANKMLDWYCLDPDGSIWKRKYMEGTLGGLPKYNEELAKQGKSIFHRPYQVGMLNCTSRRKLMRIGRQAGKSETICISMLYNIFTKEQFHVEIIAPYQAQVDLLFKRVNELISTNPILKNAIARSIKAPQYTLELNNGSQIIGFSAGTRSKQEAGASRGQHAHMLCFAKGTLVNTTEFAVAPIENLTLEHPITGGDINEIEIGEIVGLYKRDSKVITISTPLTYAQATEDHPIFNGIEDIPAKDASEAVVSLAHQDISFRIDAVKARLLGYAYINGSTDGKIISFNGKDEDLEQIAEDIAYLTGNRPVRKERGVLEDKFITSHIQRHLPAYLSMEIETPKYIRIPKHILYGSDLEKQNFLSGLFSACSLCCDKSGIDVIELSMSSAREDWIKDWANDVIELFREQGINPASYFYKVISFTSDKIGWLRREKQYHCLFRITNIDRFIEKIGCVYSVSKRKWFNKHKLYKFYSQNRPSFSFSDINDLITKLQVINKNYVKLPILKNVPPSKKQSVVYNLTSTAKHRYFGNGILTHNCFDEADMLSPQDIDAALAVIINYPEAVVLMSSTPTGRREKFYESAHNKKYKEFHFPSWVNPNWTPELDEYFHSELTEAGYEHEICFSGDTKIHTIDGVKNIKDIKTGDYVLDHHFKPILVIQGAKRTGYKSLFKFHTSAGDIVCTANHKFPNNQFQKQEIVNADTVPVYFNREENYILKKEEVYARLIGYNLGDGSSCSTRFQSSFYSNTRSDMEFLRQDVKFLYPEFKGKVVYDLIENSKKKTKSLVKVDGDRFTINVSKCITLDFIEKGVVRGRRTYQEFDIPDFVKNGTLSVKREFLAALFGAEGSTPRMVHNGFSASTVALSMSKQKGVNGHNFFSSLISLLEDFDIKSTYTHNYDDKDYQVYTLYVYNKVDNILKFFSQIGYRYSEEKEIYAWLWIHYLNYWKKTLSYKQLIYNISSDLLEEGYIYRDIANLLDITVSQVGKSKLKKEVKRLYNGQVLFFYEWIHQRLIEDALFIDVDQSKTEKIGKDDVYNITVNSPDHSYLLANNIRTFNCAEFGEQEEGVYQLKYIEAAKCSWNYGELGIDPKWSYVIGVDWNDVKIGTTIAVVGLNPLDGCFYIVDKYVVSKENRTQLTACEKIAEINRRYNAAAIYVDEGHGSTQLEMLHDYGNRMVKKQGANSPDARLRHIVKGYDFGSTVEIRDLFTKQAVKKPSKPFLVENSVRRFEQYRVKFPESDEIYAKQLLGYIIERISATGRPVYTATSEKIGDHFLDAVNLALVAYTLEKTAFGKVSYSPFIAISNQMGMDNSDIQSNRKTPESHRPKSRKVINPNSDRILINPHGQIPAKMNTDNTVQLWSWPGFGRDAPKPQVNSQSSYRMLGRQKISNKPRRKKF